MGTIRIQLDDRGYDIHISPGLLSVSGELIARVCAGRNAAIVTNPHIGALYSPDVVASLASAGISSQIITVPAGERYKTLRTVARMYERFLDQKLDRGGVVIGLGGGVIGDMAGFAAATYLRGVDFVQVPTSLLAQVDASVGGKTGVNLSRGKNLVGAFHQPKLVIIDVSVLRTLPARQFRSGLAEVIKHGIIRDESYFSFVEQNMTAIKRLDPATLEHTIQRSCEIKADVVRQDERESGLRRVLNFGHTTAHAIESLTGYGTYLHGEAVAIGMVTASILARRLGLAEPGLVERIIGILRGAGLPYRLPASVDPRLLVAAMGLDKKVAHGRLHTVLAPAIGRAMVTEDATPDAWLEALEEQQNLPE